MYIRCLSILFLEKIDGNDKSASYNDDKGNSLA